MSTRHGTSWSASFKRTSTEEEDLWAQSAGSTGPATGTTFTSPTSRRAARWLNSSATTRHGISALIALLLERARSSAARSSVPTGCLVGRLLAAGIVVLAIHPNQVKAARDRYRAAAGKNDRFDAFVLCELARTDRHRFPALAPCGDETLALKALVRTREDLVDARVALANQLRAQLQAFWPGAERIFADVDSPIALAFLERYPSPDRHPRPRREAPGKLPRPQLLLRPTHPRELLSQAAQRTRGRRRRARAGRQTHRRDRARRRAAPDRRADQPAHKPDRRRHPQPIPTGRSSSPSFATPRAS